jgi:hypothetical protein
MQFLMKNCVKYFDSFVTIANPKPNLSYTKMISTKSSTNGESLTQSGDTFVNGGRFSAKLSTNSLKTAQINMAM